MQTECRGHAGKAKKVVLALVVEMSKDNLCNAFERHNVEYLTRYLTISRYIHDQLGNQLCVHKLYERMIVFSTALLVEDTLKWTINYYK